MTIVKSLQKETQCYNFTGFRHTELCYEVYCDRVNFIGFNNTWLKDFFRRRNVVCDSDRAGYSINLTDAIKLGLPVDAKGYRLPSDARKKPIKM